MIKHLIIFLFLSSLISSDCPGQVFEEDTSPKPPSKTSIKPPKSALITTKKKNVGLKQGIKWDVPVLINFITTETCWVTVDSVDSGKIIKGETKTLKLFVGTHKFFFESEETGETLYSSFNLGRHMAKGRTYTYKVSFPKDTLPNAEPATLATEDTLQKSPESVTHSVADTLKKRTELATPPPKDTLVTSPKNVQEDYDKVFTKVEKEAKFPGGEEAWRDYLEKNLDANVAANGGAPAGNYTVKLQFIVDKTGAISNVQAIEVPKNCPDCGPEAVKVIRKGPKWEPAVQNGRNVIYQAIQFVTFPVGAATPPAGDTLQKKPEPETPAQKDTLQKDNQTGTSTAEDTSQKSKESATLPLKDILQENYEIATPTGGDTLEKEH